MTERASDRPDPLARPPVRRLPARARLVAAAALLVAGWYLAAGPARPDRMADWPAAFRRLAGKIAFVAGRAPRRSLVVVRADGFGRREVAGPADDARSPSLSVDGTRLAYLAGPPGATEARYLDLAGNRRERLPFDAGDLLSVALSPSGDRVVAAIRVESDADLFLCDLARRQVVRLTDDTADDLDPRFTPDGGRIVWVAGPEGARRLVVMRVDGANATELPFEAGAYSAPCFSPDGGGLAFVEGGSDGQSRLVRAAVDGTARVEVAAGIGRRSSPAFSPDGGRLLYAVDYGRGDELFLSPVAGGPSQRVLPAGTVAGAPAWSGRPPVPLAPVRLDLDPAEARILPSARFDLATVSATVRYPTGLAMRLTEPAWEVVAGGGTLANGAYVAPAVPEEATLRATAREGGVEISTVLTLAVAPDQVPVALKLSRTVDDATARTPYELSSLVATLSYSDGSSRTVQPAWRVKSGGGMIRAGYYLPAGEAELAILVADVAEGGVAQRAELTLSIEPAKPGDPAPAPGAAPPADDRPIPLAKLDLDKTEIHLAPTSVFDLAGLSADAIYADGTRKRVKPEWRLVSGGGELDGTRYRAAADGADARLAARYGGPEGEVEAELAVAIDNRLAVDAGGGSLLVRSVPPGATAALDGRAYPDPTDFTAHGVVPGTHRLRLERGGQRLEKEFKIADGQVLEFLATFRSLSINSELQVADRTGISPASDGTEGGVAAPPPVPVTGSIRARSLPPGAGVEVNGVGRGSADTLVTGLPPGLHRIVFTIGGRSLGTAVGVGVGQLVPVTADFERDIVRVGEEAEPLPAAGRLPARSGHAAAVFGARIVAVGGRDAGGEPLADVWSTTDGAVWTREADGSGFGGRYGHALAVHGGNLVLAGGASPAVQDDVWVSADARTFRRVAGHAEFGPRYGHALVSCAGRLWVVGGTRYDPATGSHTPADDLWASADGVSWTRVGSNLPFGRGRRLFAAALGGRLAVLPESGGKLWTTPDGATWTASDLVGGPVRPILAVGARGAALCLIAGLGDAPPTVHSVDAGGRCALLAERADLPPRRDFPLLDFNGRLFAIGGLSLATGGPLGDVWFSGDGARWSAANR